MRNYQILLLSLVSSIALIGHLSAAEYSPEYWAGAGLHGNLVALFDRVSRPGAPVNALEDWLSHPEFLTARNHYGSTALHLTARRGSDRDLILMERLHNAGTAAGINLVDLTDNVGRTPLFIAITAGEGGAAVVAQLIALGADVNLPDARGRRPLDEAQDNADLGMEDAAEIVDLLYAAGAHHSPSYGLVPAPIYQPL